MRRALLLTDKFLPEPGGSQAYLGRLYEHVQSVRATVLTRRWPAARAFDPGYLLPIRRVAYPDVPKIRMPALWAALGVRAALSVAGGRVSEVHCGQVLETGLAGWLLHRTTGRPYAVYIYGEELGVYSQGAWARRQMQRVLAGAYAVVTISEASRHALLALGVPPEKIAIAYPGVDAPLPPAPAERTREKYALGSGPVLLTVGRLSERKGQDTVLQALPALARRYPGIRYVVAGQGPYGPRLHRMAEEWGVADRVCFVPQSSDQERADLYHACDLFAMPNRTLANGDTEGFGIVFLEANLAGRAVVGGRAGGAVEAVADGESGVLVTPGDAEAVAAAIEALLSDPDRRTAMGRAGRERAASRFTWKAAAQVVDAHLEARRNGGPPAGDT